MKAALDRLASYEDNGTEAQVQPALSTWVFVHSLCVCVFFFFFCFLFFFFFAVLVNYYFFHLVLFFTKILHFCPV